MFLEFIAHVWTDDPPFCTSIDDLGLLEPSPDRLVADSGEMLELGSNLACQVGQGPSRSPRLFWWRVSTKLLGLLGNVWRVGKMPSPAPRTRSRGNGVNTSFVEVFDHLAYRLDVHAQYISDGFALPVLFSKTEDSGPAIADNVVASLPLVQSFRFLACDCSDSDCHSGSMVLLCPPKSQG